MTPLPRARKRFGQHFLEPAWVAKLLDALSPAPDDVFLEIGPGRGALTKPLAARVHRMVAVEIDRDLAAHLRAELPSSVRVAEGDFLWTPFFAMSRNRSASSVIFPITSRRRFSSSSCAGRAKDACSAMRR